MRLVLDARPDPNDNRDVMHSTTRSPAGPEPRHSAEWYGDTHADMPGRGERMFIRCEGGPCLSRLETFPPRIEIQERGGLYVLVDEGPPASWLYQFVDTIDS